MQEIYICVDDSGVLKRNNIQKYFVYAGFVFTKGNELSDAMDRYNKSKNKMKNQLNLFEKEEVKGSDLNTSHDSDEMFNTYKRIESFSAVEEVQNLYESIDDSKSINRHKDYLLRRVLKDKIVQMIDNQLIVPDIETKILIKIDNQNIASNGIYSLAEGIHEEFAKGIINFDYSVVHEKIFFNTLEVKARYINSKNDLMIQAADNLANRIWESYYHNQIKLRKKPKHFHKKYL